MIPVCNRRHLPFCSFPLVCKCIVSGGHGFGRDAVLALRLLVQIPLDDIYRASWEGREKNRGGDGSKIEVALLYYIS